MQAIKSKLIEHGYRVSDEFFDTLEEVDKTALTYARAESILLNSDIRRGNIVSPYFPANLNSMQDGAVEGSCVLQLHSAINSGISKRKQTGLVNLTQHPRILAMTFTDGHVKAIGVEVMHLKDLSSTCMAPGTKYLYRGGKVLMGKILLTPDNIKPRGGVVQHMYESWMANINVQKMRLKNVQISAKDGGPPQFELKLTEGGIAHMKKKGERVNISISDTLFEGSEEGGGRGGSLGMKSSSQSESHTNTGRNAEKGSKEERDDRDVNHNNGNRGGRGRGRGNDGRGRGSVRGRGNDGRGRGSVRGRGSRRDNEGRATGSHSSTRGKARSSSSGRGEYGDRGGYGDYDAPESANTGFDFDNDDFPTFGSSFSAALPPQPPTDNGKSWTCNSCTFANHPSLYVCEMCNTKR